MRFEFKREGSVWLEHNSIFYRLHTTREVNFSQTFKQSGVAKRTLHSLNNLFEGSVINEANPANFDFTLYLLDEASTHQNKPLDLLLDYNENSLHTFNLYFVFEDYSPAVYYKIENCVFTSGNFNLPRAGIITVSLSGEGTKLTRVTGAFTETDANYDSSPVFSLSTEFLVDVGSDSLDNILGASLEVQNNISWTPNNTIQNSLSVTDETNTTYPASFTLQGRTLGGSIRQYISETSSNLNTWAEGTTVRMRVGTSPSNIQLDINMPNACSFTNRGNFSEELFTQNYDYRLITSPNTLLDYFTY